MYLLWVHASTTVPWLVQVGSNVLWCISLPLFDIIWDVSRCTIPGAISTIICVWSWMFFFFEAGKCTKRHFLNGRKFRHFVRKFAFLGRTVAFNAVKPTTRINRAGLQVLRGDPWFEHGRGRCRYQRHGGRRLVASPRKWTGSTGGGLLLNLLRSSRQGEGTTHKMPWGSKICVGMLFLLAIFRVGVPVKSCHLKRFKTLWRPS